MSYTRVRVLSGVRAVPSSVPSDGDLAEINSTLRQSVAAEDVHVRQARVAHNQHDRTLERFPKAYLERFAETLPGKSLLPGHDTGALPLGRWFRADVRARTEEFPVLVRGKAAEVVPGMEPQKIRVHWLESAFYFAADPSTEGFRKNIDLGVYQDVSIGFRYADIDCDVCRKSYFGDCPHYRGQKLEDGQVVTLTYSGDAKDAEAQETSLVYLGAQQHAELIKSLRTGSVDPKALAQTPIGEDLAALKEYEALARIHGHQQKTWAFPALKFPSSIGEGEPPVGGDDTTASVGATTQENDMNLAEMAKAIGLPDTATEDEVKAAAVTAQGFKARAEIGDRYLDALKEQIVTDDCKLTGNSEPGSELLEVLQLLVRSGNDARLKAIADEKRAAVFAKFPAGRIGLTETEMESEPRLPRRRSTEFAVC